MRKYLTLVYMAPVNGYKFDKYVLTNMTHINGYNFTNTTSVNGYKLDKYGLSQRV